MMQSSNEITNSTMSSTVLSSTSYNGTDESHRVLIYTTCYNIIDGVTLTVRKLEKEILDLGGHVCILTTSSGDINNTNMNGTHPNRKVIFLDNAIEIPFLKDAKNPNMSYCFGMSLSKSTQAEMNAFAPTLVHITVPDCTGLHVIEYARSKQLPLMATYHSNIPDYLDHYPGMKWLKPVLWGFFKQSYNFMQRLYVPTPFIRENLINQQKLNCLTDMGVWGRGVDLQKFSPRFRSTMFRQKLGIADDVPVILFVGRLVAEKRPDIFANVIRRLIQQNVSFHALVVGAGHPFDEVFANLPNCTPLGWLNGDKLSEAYASSDIFLFPSAVETFGNVTLEAAASGLPLVVERGCSGHLVKEDFNGFGCPEGDEDSYFEATLRLCLDSQLRHKFSRESLKVGESMEQHKVSQMMIRNYHEVTQEFYSTYMGRHSERDEVFSQKEGSFYGGTKPRPVGFGLIENIFIRITRMLFTGYYFYQWCQDVIRLTFFLRRDQQSLVQLDDSSTSSSDDDALSIQSSSDDDGLDLYQVQVSNLEKSLQKQKAVPTAPTVDIVNRSNNNIERNSNNSYKSCVSRIGDSDCSYNTCNAWILCLFIGFRSLTILHSYLFFWKGCRWRTSLRLPRLRRQPKREDHLKDEQQSSSPECMVSSGASTQLDRRINRQKSVSSLDLV